MAKLLGKFDKCRILVVGDVMLDRYLWGTVSRISPEAPVPIVEIAREEYLLGGAANVANNIAALHGKPILVGVVGSDNSGALVRRELQARRFLFDGVFTDRNRPTTVKTRILAHNQQLVRADREITGELSPRLTERMVGFVNKVISRVDGVIISDYGKGVISLKLLDSLIAMCNKRGIFVAVDPKETHFFNYRRISAITPNHLEAGFVVGKKIKDETTLAEVGWRILEQLEARSVLITLGEKGMALFEDGQLRSGRRHITRIPTMARDVYDVTGAGDTVIATLTMAVAAGGSLKEAAFISNVAAGEVVAHVGTAQVAKDRLKQLLLGLSGRKSQTR